ncbi:MAG: PH domain-containing protein [Rufibacter sp.]
MVAQRFSSEKNWFVTVAFWGTVLLLVALAAREVAVDGLSLETLVLCLFSLAVSGLLLWIWFGTYYTINGATLYYASGPMKGRLGIQRINRIQKNVRLWSGFRPALGLKGLVIYYNKWDELYLSPKDRERFVEMLLVVNKEIVVEG